MPRRYLASSALLPSGWAERVLIVVGDDGMIASVAASEVGASDAERLNGPVIPGIPNLHSHAFQRAMAGLNQKAGPEGDSFWAWRELMYRFLARLTPDDVEAIATQLYIEMLEAGYTSVAEFHYLHHDPAGEPYANAVEMAERICAAAITAGIGLTLLPVFYAHSHFGGLAPAPGQRRFITDTDCFARMLDTLGPPLHEHPMQRLGVAPHSLRAVAPDELQRVLEHCVSLDDAMPVHIHAAEQRREVDDCIAWSGTRPVQWLLDNVVLNERWCVIHATHMDETETVALARSKAVAGLCPTTEGDLGDGLFNAKTYLAHHGRFGIGGDSHVSVDPFLELRLFEYGQRMTCQQRNVFGLARAESFAGRLYRDACRGGAQALGQRIGAIAVHHRADWIVLDGNDLAIAERRGDELLDSAIFGPVRAPICDVMVGGQWRVRDGAHSRSEQSATRYRSTLKRLLT
ncbi:MAG: formimidoylglutamate deiminase [Pseudomonadota bacterium]|nr:formimidoylglutamate deiminase [Pseudomonadota bacterium]